MKKFCGRVTWTEIHVGLWIAKNSALPKAGLLTFQRWVSGSCRLDQLIVGNRWQSMIEVREQFVAIRKVDRDRVKHRLVCSAWSECAQWPKGLFRKDDIDVVRLKTELQKLKILPIVMRWKITYLRLGSELLVLVDFHGNIEFTLFGNELKSSLNGLDGKVQGDAVLVLVGALPLEDQLGLGVWRGLVVDFVSVDVI